MTSNREYCEWKDKGQKNNNQNYLPKPLEKCSFSPSRNETSDTKLSLLLPR